MNQSVGKYRMLLLHVSFWILYFSYRVYDVHEYIGIDKAVVYVGLPMVFNLIGSYVHYFLVIPFWLKHKRIITYALFTILTISGVVTLRLIVENYVFPGMTISDYYDTLRLPRVISTIWDTLTFVIFTGMIRFTVDRFDLENKRKELENERLAAELNYLKAQINPHFLFNTLHNLNSLVYSKSEKATEVIIKLSNIMRYMIYDAKKEKVPLAGELNYISDYIHLQSIRLNNEVDIFFEKEGEVANVEIAPLILITLLENSFKHGVTDGDPESWIKAQLKVSKDNIFFSVSNSKLGQSEEGMKSGFGLQNLRKRLSLSYPGKHELIIKEDNLTYTAVLTVSLE